MIEWINLGLIVVNIIFMFVIISLHFKVESLYKFLYDKYKPEESKDMVIDNLFQNLYS